MTQEEKNLFDKLSLRFEISFKEKIFYGTISRVQHDFFTVDFELGGYCMLKCDRSMIEAKLHRNFQFLATFICEQLHVGNRVGVMYNKSAESFELVSVQINGCYLFGNGDEAVLSFDRNTLHVCGKIPPELVLTPSQNVSFYLSLPEGIATRITSFQQPNNASTIRIDSPEQEEIFYEELQEVYPAWITPLKPELLASRHRAVIYKALLNIPSEAKAKNFKALRHPPFSIGERIIGYLHPGSHEENENLAISSTQNCQFFGNCQLSEKRSQYIFYLLCADEQTMYIYLAARLKD